MERCLGYSSAFTQLGELQDLANGQARLNQSRTALPWCVVKRVQMVRHRLCLLASLAFGCTEDHWVPSDPKVDPTPNAACGASARMVRDICVRLGPADACVETGDVCVALCDDLSQCAMVGEVRAMHLWAIAPKGYCVECVQ